MITFQTFHLLEITKSNYKIIITGTFIYILYNVITSCPALSDHTKRLLLYLLNSKDIIILIFSKDWNYVIYVFTFNFDSFSSLWLQTLYSNSLSAGEGKVRQFVIVERFTRRRIIQTYKSSFSLGEQERNSRSRLMCYFWARKMRKQTKIL